MLNSEFEKNKFFQTKLHDPVLMTLKQRAFESIVGKRPNAGNRHYLLSPQSFLPVQRWKLPFQPFNSYHTTKF